MAKGDEIMKKVD